MNLSLLIYFLVTYFMYHIDINISKTNANILKYRTRVLLMMTIFSWISPYKNNLFHDYARNVASPGSALIRLLLKENSKKSQAWLNVKHFIEFHRNQDWFNANSAYFNLSNVLFYDALKRKWDYRWFKMFLPISH